MKELKSIEYVLGEGKLYSLYLWVWLTIFPLSDFLFLFPRPHFLFAFARELWSSPPLPPPRPLASEGWAVVGSPRLARLTCAPASIPGGVSEVAGQAARDPEDHALRSPDCREGSRLREEAGFTRGTGLVEVRTGARTQSPDS